MTPAKAAALAQAIYSPVTPGIFSSVQSFDAVTVGLSKDGDTTCITFAGSESGLDWVRDFQATPFKHPQLGTIHDGFWQGMGPAFKALYPKLSGKIAIIGHSLGAAHAAILAGLCAINHIPVDQLFLFAPPKPGYSTLALLVDNWVREAHAYQNGDDPVPDVPVFIPVIAPWRQVAPITSINVPPTGADAYDPFSWHAMGLYKEGVSS